MMKKGKQFRAQALRQEVTVEDSGEFKLRIEFAPHELLIFRLEFFQGQASNEEEAKELEYIINYLRAHLTKLVPEKDDAGTLGFKVAGFGYRLAEGEDPDSVKAEIIKILSHPLCSLAISEMAGAAHKYLEFIKQREEELRKREEELKKQEKVVARREKRMAKREVKPIKMGVHMVSQFFEEKKLLTVFSSMIEKSDQHELEGWEKGYGLDLNQTESRVLEAIIRRFSDTNYKGDKTIDKGTYQAVELNGRKAGPAFDNIGQIPIIKITQAELIELAGYDQAAQRFVDKKEVVKALMNLGRKQFAFFWDRIRKDDKGRIIKKADGDFLKEFVMEVGSILRVQVVLSKQTNKLNYYEIQPSPVMLDQVTPDFGGTHFIFYPQDWRDEVKAISGGRRVSEYTFRFMMWLRLQCAKIQRNNDKVQRTKKGAPRPYLIRKLWEEIALELKMPETMYKANRKRAYQIIQDAYEIAERLGYLERVDRDDIAGDTLYLNPEKYQAAG